MILKCKLLIGHLLYAIHIHYFRTSNQRLKIETDIKRWCEELNIIGYSKIESLVFLLMFRPQFRNLFYHRIRPRFNFIKKICPPCSQL